MGLSPEHALPYPCPTEGLTPLSWPDGARGVGQWGLSGGRAHSFLTSFPAPRKPATKKEGKEEGPGAPRKEEAKG